MPDKEGKQRDRHQTGLADLPPEVVLEHLLPVMGDKDIAALSATSKELNVICNTDAFWLERTRTVFSYNPSTLAPAPSTQPIERSSEEEEGAQVSWSKRLYIGLSHPRTFLWGSEGNGRQGLEDARSGRPYAYRRGIRGINRPKEATWQFDLVRSRIQQERNDRQATGGAQGAGWMANFGNSLRRAAGYGGGGDAVDSRGDTGTNTMASSRGGGDGIVELQAGGWSFAARDMQGVIWVWGQMDGSGFNMGGQGWHHPRHTVEEPTPVPLPCRAEAVSVGRNHMLVLDQDNLIWELRSWGRAYHHTAPTLTSPTNPGSTKRPHHIIQVSAGWSHSACLTSSGRVIVWYPFSNAYRDSLTSDTELNGAPGVDENRPFNYRRYTKWGTVGDVVSELPPLPERPEWDRVKYPMVPGLQRTRQDIEREWEEYAHESGWRSEKDAEEAGKVVKIASGSDFVIVLRKNGEMWYRHLGDSFDPTEVWQYLPFFSSPKVSHMTAGMSTITSYSTSRPSRVNHGRLTPAIVSNGNTEWGNNLYPDPLVELQGQNVIQVALGDYHNLALTARGEVYAWGQGDEGQLGLGQEGVRGPVVNAPKRVSFLLPPTSADGYDEAEDRELRRQVEGRDHGAENDEGKDEEPFVFAIAAAGWHSGALVLGDPRRSQRNASRASTSTAVSQAAGSEWDGVFAAQGHGLQPRIGHTGRMIYPEGALQVQPQAPSFTRGPPSVNQPFGGGPMFRVGLAGALAQHQSSEASGGAASDSNMAGAASSSRGGGLTGSIRRWVKREAHSGTPSSSTSSTAPAPAFSNDVAQASGGPGGSAGAARDGGDDLSFRPLSGGYAEAAQLRPDDPVNVNGQPTPAFTRGAGQSTYVPAALQDQSHAASSTDTRRGGSPAREQGN